LHEKLSQFPESPSVVRALWQEVTVLVSNSQLAAVPSKFVATAEALAVLALIVRVDPDDEEEDDPEHPQ